jgi:hypothetical protein
VGHRLFNAVVVVFWLSTMTWLIVAKVLPPLQIGEPPSYRSVYSVDSEQTPAPVCWEMQWNDRPMGWAVTNVNRTRSGVTEVRSLVHFSRVPVEELAPPLIRPALRKAVEPIGTLAMDAESRLEIDPLGRLERIYSTMSASNYPAGIVIRGRVHGTTLKGEVRTGRMVYPFERYLPSDALLGDELSPQGRMPGLRIGQEWTMPVYSPLRFSDSRNPVEILHAKVEGRESVVVDDQAVLTLVVVYRSDAGSILGSTRRPRGKLWVADDGTVLKQTTHLMGSQLTFLRATGKRSEEILRDGEELAERLGQSRQRSRRSRWPPGGERSNSPAGGGSESTNAGGAPNGSGETGDTGAAGETGLAGGEPRADSSSDLTSGRRGDDRD